MIIKAKRMAEYEVDFAPEVTALLSVEEAENLPEHLTHYNDCWWLRSTGSHQDSAAGVYTDGGVNYYGVDVCSDHDVVRPALLFKSDNLRIGDIFVFGGAEFEVIKDGMAFCRTDIGHSRFDKKTNDYERSEIKVFVDSWFKNAKLELEAVAAKEFSAVKAKDLSAVKDFPKKLTMDDVKRFVSEKKRIPDITEEDE